MKKIILFILSFIALTAATPQKKIPCVVGQLNSQLGNQMFQVAAIASLAWDHDAYPLFPDLRYSKEWNIRTNAHYVFSRFDSSSPPCKLSKLYSEPAIIEYQPIPYTPNMKVYGFFQTDKHFRHHKERILELFRPLAETENYLKTVYEDILNHPCSCAVHVRSYKNENPKFAAYIGYVGKKYFQEAMKFFPKDTLFVFCSDQIAWCEEEFKDLECNKIFIDNEEYYNELYLMSFCKHQIISNSTFSWWSAYMNKNPEKIVVAPSPWYLGDASVNNDHIIPEDEDWITLDYRMLK